MKQDLESAAAIGAVDAILAGVGLAHGRRKTRKGSWAGGERVKPVRASAAAALKRGKATSPVVVRVPGWEVHKWLRAGFSTRLGGVSSVYSGKAGPGELNLGWTASDTAANVRANRKAFAKEIASGKKMELAALHQFHSGLVRVVEAGHGPLTKPDGRAAWKADGWMTAEPGLLLGVQTADCIPVLVADTRLRVVAAFHAGWRGTLARIVERGVGAMQLQYGSRPQDLIAAVGPGIGACCYAVGEEVRFEFESQFAYGRELFTEVYDSDPVREKYPLLFLTARAPGHSNIGPQIHVDLWEANRRQLLDAGVAPERIHVVGECTGCARGEDGRLRYYSHRMEQGFAGRMMAAIGIV
jgi:YfiH family protein